MGLKILLLKDVENLGLAGQIATAKPGFVRNFLVPFGHAEIATKQALRKQARIQEQRRRQAIHDRTDAENVAAALKDIILTTAVKVDQEGHMYGSVSALDIIHLLQEQAKINLEKRNVHLKHPIKHIGQHIVPLKLKEGVTCEVAVEITAEGAEGANTLVTS